MCNNWEGNNYCYCTDLARVEYKQNMFNAE